MSLQKTEKNLLLTKIFLAGIIFSPLSFSQQILDATLVPRFLTLAIFLAMTVLFFQRYKLKPQIEWNIVTASYFLFMILCIGSFAWANTRSEAIFESAKVVLGFTVFSLTIFSLKRQPDFFKDSLYKFSIAIVFIGAGFAFWQYSKIRIHDKESLYTISAINGHKNLYASFLLLNLFFLIRAAMHFKSVFKILSVAAILITLGIIVFIRTKAVWIGLGVGTVIFVLLYLMSWIKARPNFFLALAGCLICANLFFVFILPKAIERTIGRNMAIGNQASAEEKAKELDNERLTLWQKTYEMVRKHPGGVGMGNWQVYFPDATLKGLWRAEDLNFTFQRPHNDLLWILSETGWAGLNLFLIFIFSLFLFLFRAARLSQANEREKIKMMLCIAFIAAFLAASFFDFPKERIEHIVWLNLIFGIAYVYIQQYSDIKMFKKTMLPPFFILLSFSILISIVGIGLLRYKGEYYTRLMYNERFLKQEARAIIDGEEAVSFAYCLDPTSVPVHWYTANSYVNLKNYEKAQTDFILAYKENPYNRNVLNDLGSSYSFSNNDSLAKVCYRAALRISPRFDDPKLNLAAIYIREKKFREADTCLKLMFHDSERRSQYQKLVDAFK